MPQNANKLMAHSNNSVRPPYFQPADIDGEFIISNLDWLFQASKQLLVSQFGEFHFKLFLMVSQFYIHLRVSAASVIFLAESLK
jgi:hypothetical protein